jgi:SPP1 gp7 family putative phage head morphogenesis protein
MSRSQRQETERTPVEERTNPQPGHSITATVDDDPALRTDGFVVVPMAAAAALDSSVFSKVNASEAVPATWEERASKAWEYYLEEPLVKNCINSWRTFAVGDEIKIAGDDEKVKWEAMDPSDRLGVSAFVKDMILQLLVKGNAVGFKRYTKDGKDLEELVCVNPVSIKVKYAQGQLAEVRQFPEDHPSVGEGLDLPVDQVLHLKWDAPSFSPRGNSMVLPAFQSIELLRDYRRAEQAIAKRWTTPFRLLKVGGAFGQKMVMPDQKMLEQVRDMVNKMDLKSGLVVPFYVTVETHGTDGQVLNVEDKVKEVKEDIVVALGLSRSLVTGDGPNFATASVSLQKMLVMIREIKQAARAILDWLFNDWLELNGWSDKTIQFLFNDLDPTDALDFMTNYNLVLAGDVHRELADGIKRTVMNGIATGKGVEDIARDLGRVVKDPESFRHAGSKVFSKAQYRMELIARTEVLRAHNQGRIKFHDRVGVRKLEWMTMEDERVCPICGPLLTKRTAPKEARRQPN